MPGMQWERQVGSGARWLSAADTTEIAELLQARVREQEAELGGDSDGGDDEGSSGEGAGADSDNDFG